MVKQSYVKRFLNIRLKRFCASRLYILVPGVCIVFLGVLDFLGIVVVPWHWVAAFSAACLFLGIEAFSYIGETMVPNLRPRKFLVLRYICFVAAAASSIILLHFFAKVVNDLANFGKHATLLGTGIALISLAPRGLPEYFLEEHFKAQLSLKDQEIHDLKNEIQQLKEKELE